MADAELGRALGFILREMTEIVAKPLHRAAIEAGPEGRLAQRYAAALGHALIVVGDPRDHMDVRVDIEGHGRNSCCFWMTRIRTTIVPQLRREGKEDRATVLFACPVLSRKAGTGKVATTCSPDYTYRPVQTILTASSTSSSTEGAMNRTMFAALTIVLVFEAG